MDEMVLLTPDRLDEWLAFFDGPAFEDNPEWGTCYCRCLVFGAQGREAWEQACATAGLNRGIMADAIRAGTIDGVLARRDGETVGWLHFGPATRFSSPIGTGWGAEPDAGAVVCFMVHRHHRGTGIARAMLEHACEELARRGFRRVNALAMRDDTAEAMHQFTGPLALYRSAGFEPTGEEVGTRVRLSRALG